MTAVSELITRALQPMRDPDQDFFDDPELLAYLNEATRDLSARLRLYEKEQDADITDTEIALPSDCLKVRWLRATDDTQVVFMDENTFFAYRGGGDFAPEAPIATNYMDKIVTAPALTGTWRLGYFGLPDQMTSIGEEFPLVGIYEDKVVHFIRSRCYRRLGESRDSEEELLLYEAGLPSPDRSFSKNTPGIMVISRQGNAFDLDPDTIHRGSR